VPSKIASKLITALVLAMLAAGVTTFALKTTQPVDTTQPPALLTSHLLKLQDEMALP
jgi:hypothetical protein